VVPEVQLAKIPEGVDFATAAALPLVAITAWESLYDRARLEAGEHVLIHAGAGGTGHIAVQLAKLKGAKVAATVSSPEKAAFVRGLGADLAIDYKREDAVAAALAWSGGGVDVALDNVGAEAMQATYRAMAPYGRIVTLMGTPGDDADMTAYNRNLSIINEMMLAPMWLGLDGRLAAQARIVREALALVAAGKLKPHIAARFPWREAKAAHERLDTGGTTGKIILVME
jgi:NADPH2:quinone reductase